MPHKPRLFASGGIYHVYCKTHRSEARFHRPEEARAFVEAVADIAATHRLEVLAWALLSNHYHLVVRTADVMLWRSMASIQSRVTRAFNRRCRVAGPGWQSRYRARLIQDERDLRHLLAYVHLNPVMAGLVDDPADYRFSGHCSLIGLTPPVLVDVVAALRCFGDVPPSVAASAYLECIRSVAAAKWARGTVRRLPWWRSIGDDHQTVEAAHAHAELRTFDDRNPDLPLAPAEDIDSLLTRACRLLDTSLAVLAGVGKGGSIPSARRRLAFVAICHFRHRGAAVARSLGKSPSQVSRWLAQEIAVCASDPGEAVFVDRLARRLLEEGSPEPQKGGPAAADGMGNARSANLAP